MRGWLLDTNVVAALINPQGAPSVKTWAASQDEGLFHISVLTLAEYDKGIHNLPDDHVDRLRYAAARDALEVRFGDRVLSLGDATLRRWGRLAGQIKRETKHSPPVIDTMLAATAIEHDLYLVTRNVKDVKASGATVFNPWADDVARFPISPRGRKSRSR